MAYATEAKAKAIVTAALHTDREAAEECDVSARSIKRWRSQLDEDPELARFVTLKWNEVRKLDTWAEEATWAIRKALSFVRTAMDELDPSRADDVQVAIEAIHTLSRAKLAHDVIEERLTHDRKRATRGGPADENVAGRIGPTGAHSG